MKIGAHGCALFHVGEPLDNVTIWEVAAPPARIPVDEKTMNELKTKNCALASTLNSAGSPIFPPGGHRYGGCFYTPALTRRRRHPLPMDAAVYRHVLETADALCRELGHLR
ncbi:MAG: hypothetical protein IPM76_24330 [Chloroflexi bacterium]|nr:hypothetical protein [Chloroflexota bacterium]